MRILFADGSPDRCGHTAFPLALLTNREYEPLNLTCCTIGAYGSSFPAAGWMPPWGRRTPSLSVCRCTGTASAAASATRPLVSTTVFRTECIPAKPSGISSIPSAISFTRICKKRRGRKAEWETPSGRKKSALCFRSVRLVRVDLIL